jgi:hypothetical protein
MKRIIIKIMLVVGVYFGTMPKANSGITVFGVGGFDDAAWNAMIVEVLGAIEMLNTVANSNTFQMMGSLKEMREKVQKVAETAKKIHAAYTKSKTVLEMGAMTASTVSAYAEMIKHIKDHGELLNPEHIKFFSNLLDYAVFDVIAAGEKKDSTVNKSAADVGGGVLDQLKDIFNWILNNPDSEVERIKLDERVAATYKELARINRDLRVVQRYVYSFLVMKRYKSGVYDNAEYIKYVYDSKYSTMATKK